MVGGDDEGARAEGLEGEAGGGFPRGIIEAGEGLVEDDEGGVMGQRSGQLDAAALTAGAAAQFMQWAVVEGNSLLAETEEVRNYFIQGAVRTAELSYPSREWGESGIIVSS